MCESDVMKDENVQLKHHIVITRLASPSFHQIKKKHFIERTMRDDVQVHLAHLMRFKFCSSFLFLIESFIIVLLRSRSH